MGRAVAGSVRLAPASATVAAVALIGGWTLAAGLQGAGFDPTRDSISALASTGTPHRSAMTAALVITGVAHVGTAWALGTAARPWGRRLLGLAGVATLAAAALPQPSRTESSTAHVAATWIAFTLLAAWPWFAAHHDAAPPLRPRVARVATLVLGLAVSTLPLAMVAGWSRFGLLERLVAGALVVWPVVVAVEVWYAAGHDLGRPWVRRTLGVLGLTLACLAGGVVATTVAPVTTHTQYYRASLSLSPNVLEHSRLQASTVFGNIEMGFAGVAPGVDVDPQVKAEIAVLLNKPDIGLSSLEPSAAELDTAIHTAAVGLGVRFAVGSGLVALLGALLYAALLRRRPWFRLIALSTGAWSVAAIVMATSITQTYQPSRQASFTGTGVLGIVQQNRSLLSDVAARSSQVTPYLRNLIALSTALQQNYTPTTLDQPVALRLLFVSDLHDGNQYSLMKTIVTDEKIDAVVDLGDLVDFGTAQEAEAVGMFSGIASLGVPYIFVRGNHDASSPTDTGLLDRMRRISNVVLLQPTADSYTEVTLHGVRIAGFNDPRWFGDDGKNSPQKEKPAQEAFQKAYADRAPLDLVISHEPWAVQGLGLGAVVANGHIHSPDLEGNRIQVGTFTGGGPLSHYIAADDGSELVGQPSAFDIVTYGTDCRLTSLTRFRFHNIIEGRPVYDDVSLINGTRIDTRSADPERGCVSDASLSVQSVAAVP
jgi:predicted phosphodiesterase/hypothetical membrane protein